MVGNSLVVQWLAPCFHCMAGRGAQVQSLVGELRSRKPRSAADETHTHTHTHTQNQGAKQWLSKKCQGGVGGSWAKGKTHKRETSTPSTAGPVAPLHLLLTHPTATSLLL